MKVEEVLTNIGLTENETKSYLALLRLGEVRATEIAKETSINRSLMYRILDSLKEKGLISSVVKEHRTYFSAGNPKHLKKILQEKESDLNDIMKNLMSLQSQKPQEMIVEVYSGLKGLKTVLREQLEKSKEFFVLGAGDEFASVTEHFYDNYYLKRIKSKILQKVLFKYDTKERAIKAAHTPYSEVRILNKTYRVPMAIVIYGNNTALFSWKDQKAVVMRSKNIAEGFKEQFSILWNSSNPLK